MIERLFKYAVPILAVLSHVCAYFQFRFQSANLPLPPQWTLQFNILISFSFLLTLAMTIWRRMPLIWTGLCLKFFILILIGLPMGSYLGVEFTLTAALLTEALYYVKLGEGLWFSAILIITILFLQRHVKVWDRVLPAPPPHDVLSLVMYSASITILSLLFRLQSTPPQREIQRRLHQATFRLAETNMQLQEYAATIEEQTAANERKRIGREIHDTLGYTLTNLLMMLEAALGLYEEKAKELPDHLERTRDQAKEGLLEIRRALVSLRPNQNPTRGLPAVKKLVETFQQATQVEVDLNLGDAPLFFGEEADLAAYRFVQEGMTNAIRHGKATRIQVSFYKKDEGVDIYIRDNGIGAIKVEAGYGLTGMRERIERLGGTFGAVSEPGEGFRITAWIPVEK